MEEIKKAIVLLIETRFAGTPKQDLAQLFKELSSEFQARAEEEGNLESTLGGSFEVWARSNEEVFRLLRDTLSVGAVIFDQITSAENLHEQVNVELHIPQEHVHISTTGQVLHVYETGTAIELNEITPSDRATLEQIYDRMKRRGVASGPTSTPPTPPRNAEAPPAKMVELHVPLRNLGGRGSSVVPPSRVSAFRRSPSQAEEQSGDSVRQLYDIPEPDDAVVQIPGPSEATHGPVDSRTTSELFGPATPWITPKEGPDRKEDLAGERIRDILMQIVYESFTGIVECAHEDRRYQLKFQNGLFVQVAAFPRIPEFEFGPMIRDANHIDSSQLAMASAYADENHIEIERALIDLDILDVPKIRSAIAGRLTFFLKRILKWKSGKLRIYNADKCEPGFLPEPPLLVPVFVERTLFSMFYEETRALNRQRRERLVFPHLESYPEIRPEDRVYIEHALTEPEHQALIDRITSTRRRLQEVITESAISNTETLSVLWSLYRMGLLRFDTSLHQTIVRERYREKVTVKYLSVHKASYFEVLNVHWSSYDELVEAAYEDLCQQFDPKSVPDNIEPEVLERVIEIRQQIDDAYSVLSTRETRHAYRKRVMPKYKLSHAIPLFLKQIELAIQRQDLDDARDNILRVLEIEPDNVRAKRLLKSIEE